MNDLHLQFIESYKNGSLPQHDLAESEIVTIHDHDVTTYIYKADTDEEAARLAELFVAAEDADSNCQFFKLIKNHARSFTTEAYDENPDYEELQAYGEIITTAYDGTCELYKYNGLYFAVLQDNTVITQEEDESDDNPIFDYENEEANDK